tara:strand:- start:489 stop:1736 length:1248 start_codon:yes stop_codon:yes gene_type:complete
MSRNEKRKAAFQAAKDDAAKVREKNRKILHDVLDHPERQRELRADLIQDLRRVFDHPDNPFSGFAASRKRYVELGHYPEHLVHAFFGNHTEFLRAAGLHDLRTTTKVRNRAAQLHSHQRIAEFAEENVLRYTDRFQIAAGRQHLEILVASDFHSQFCDPFALEVFLESCAMVQPDIIAVNGDLVDFPAFSRHQNLPGHFHISAWDECVWGKDLFARLRHICPNSEITFIIGNHEYRLVRYLADSALSSFPCLSFEEIFGLTEFEVNLVCRSSFLAPTSKARAKDVRENWAVYGDCYTITHGQSIAIHAAQQQLKRYGMAGTSGHTHRPQLFTDNTLGAGPLSWMSTPMMAHACVGSDYMPDPTRWNGGFGHAAVLTTKQCVSQEIILVHPEWATFAGRSWTPTDKARKTREDMTP